MHSDVWVYVGCPHEFRTFSQLKKNLKAWIFIVLIVEDAIFLFYGNLGPPFVSHYLFDDCCNRLATEFELVGMPKVVEEKTGYSIEECYCYSNNE